MGHLPKFISKLAHFFVKHAEKIRCEITGSKRPRWFGDSSKIIFQNSNERIVEEMKKKLAPRIEEYNKKH